MMFTPKRVAVDVVNGKRDAVERDRPLRRDEGREVARALDQEPGAVAVGLARRRSSPVHRHGRSPDGRQAHRRSVSARSRLMRRPSCQVSSVVRAKVSFEASTAKTAPLPFALPMPTMVRQQPSQAMEAPSSRLRRLIGAGDQKGRPLALEQRAYAADNAGEHRRTRRHHVIRSGPNERASSCMKCPLEVTGSSPSLTKGRSPSGPAGFGP